MLTPREIYLESLHWSILELFYIEVLKIVNSNLEG